MNLRPSRRLIAIGLVLVRLWLLPLALFTLGAYSTLTTLRRFGSRARRTHPGQKVFLVSGGGETSATLAICRLLHDAGHAVYLYLASNEPLQQRLVDGLQRSNSVDKIIQLQDHGSMLLDSLFSVITRSFHFGSFFQLDVRIGKHTAQLNIADRLLEVIQNEGVHVWINCQRDEDPAMRDAEFAVHKNTSCHIVSAPHHFPTSGLPFASFVDQLGADIHCARKITVKSRAEIHDLLWDSPTTFSYLLKPIPEERSRRSSSMSDVDYAAWVKESSMVQHANRDSGYGSSAILLENEFDDLDDLPEDGSLLEKDSIHSVITLPGSSISATYNQAATIAVSASHPWEMTQLVRGTPCTVSALVIEHKIRLFVAWTSPSTAAHHAQPTAGRRLLDPASALAKTLLAFTSRLADRLPTDAPPSTHLTIAFTVSETATSSGAEQTVWPLSCSFAPQPLLFNAARRAGLARPAADAYSFADDFTAATASATDNDDDAPASDMSSLVSALRAATAREKALEPLCFGGVARLPAAARSTYSLVAGVKATARELSDLVDAALFGGEHLFELRDPWPAIWRWNVQWILTGRIDTH